MYNFNYYEDNNITLPDKNAADKKDHLGYFNNQSHFYTTYKTKDEVYEMATAPYKSSDLEASQLTVLKSIEYPTKGKDEFIYALGSRGGLNIESIKTYENINNTIPSSYKNSNIMTVIVLNQDIQILFLQMYLKVSMKEYL